MFDAARRPGRVGLAAGLSANDAARWHPHVLETAERFDINTVARLSMFLAQCAHESAGFTRLVENLNYRPATLMRVWPKRFPNIEAARKYAHAPEKLANYVYANRADLGNGDEASGDGWRFRGRGLIQITGRSNYEACGLALGVDLLTSPDILATDRYAALSAGWFWHRRGLNYLADAGEFETVTRRINGGTTGLADRRLRWERARDALGVQAT